VKPHGKLSEIESPVAYPADAADRAEWLRVRDWTRLDKNGTGSQEIWRNEDGHIIQGRTAACRYQLGLAPTMQDRQ